MQSTANPRPSMLSLRVSSKNRASETRPSRIVWRGESTALSRLFKSLSFAHSFAASTAGEGPNYLARLREAGERGRGTAGHSPLSLSAMNE